ncbi:MAG: hypothetical protein HOG03_06565 [Desulfobacula sp.]|jgi:hypothetical protein|uniref:multiheme c-type cytochrome n=2 Tax=Desulfobacula sp. TaxID=2593537 RepID=UPI001D28934F|nr:hypothetical protein [Desulfobacula sp.]MBT3484278.1 hypothetical protein [Desulfobacula sp.]MBT3804248.1 hypothetical protein [Desulfobacula sp.]MBT4025628.1 hypothetical protein [Desulfobacula sp.]MBT4198204.1 hypothetical protein [Desulfobacula sp.]
MKTHSWILIAVLILLSLFVVNCGTDSSQKSFDLEKILSKSKMYVGSSECKFCHLEHNHSWETTLHSRTLQDVTENRDALIVEFEPEVIRADLKQSEEKLKVSIDKIYIPKIEDVKYTMGMQWEQAFLIEKNKILYVAPILYNARDNKWYSRNEDKWDKEPWIEKCGGCHATGVDLKENKFSEPRVGCEACHGPGSHHIALPETAVFQKHRTIVNPSHLPAAFRTQICGSCHSRGRSTKVKGVEWPVQYLPGRSLDIYYEPVSPGSGGNEFFYPNDFAKGRYMQFNDWKKSAHAREGVSCTSCHYVHRLGVPPNQYQTRGAGSQQCLLCHKMINNNMSHSIHSFANCIGCHMPKISQNGGAGITHSHVFKTILPKDTLKNPEIPNACQNCHKHKETDLMTLQKLFDSLSQKTLLRVHQTPPRW